GDHESPGLQRKQATENADATGTGRQIDERLPAALRQVRHVLNPSAREAALGALFPADEVAAPQPQTPVMSGGQLRERRRLVATVFRKGRLDFGRRPDLALVVTRDFNASRASEGRSLIAILTIEPIALVLPPVVAALFPGDPHAPVRRGGDARVSFVVARHGD